MRSLAVAYLFNSSTVALRVSRARSMCVCVCVCRRFGSRAVVVVDFCAQTNYQIRRRSRPALLSVAVGFVRDLRVFCAATAINTISGLAGDDRGDGDGGSGGDRATGTVILCSRALVQGAERRRRRRGHNTHANTKQIETHICDEHTRTHAHNKTHEVAHSIVAERYRVWQSE